ncbi:MAG: lamin tail domain-containing protein [Lentisphaeria bacterium]|nr:lamin tail domain-containing protein [Candidatus Neomarinimicrobiota bacterium]MCF7841689.1 lamin tail domain-containing protein [Lentisphaeria bacterium]
MKRRILFILYFFSSIFGQITLSEAMVNPGGLESTDEFLEVYHLGEANLSLTDWVISDGTGTDTLIHWVGPDSVSPGQFALILDPDYDLASGLYWEEPPQNIPIFTSGTDASLGSGGFTNSGEAAFLISPAGDTVSQFAWSSSPPNGYSFEKILPWGSDSEENWVIAMTENGTPGRTNSVTPPPINCSLDSITIGVIPDSAPAGIQIYLHLHNAGLQLLDSVAVSIVLDENQDSTLTTGELETTTFVVTSLAWLDTLTVALESPSIQYGINQLIARVSASGDTIGHDDVRLFRLNLSPPQDALVLNEIHYRPDDEQTEFIELLNTSADAINLQLFHIQDATSSMGFFPDEPLWLDSGEFTVIAPDETMSSSLPSGETLYIIPDRWPSLNNSSDSVRISDASGERLITSWYASGWGGGEGMSLERRAVWLPADDPENWGTSQAGDGMTPGDTNSIVWPEYGLDLNITIQPEHPRRMDSILVTVEITGQGRFITTSGLLQLTLDELEIASEIAGIPAFGETTRIQFSIPPLSMGRHFLGVHYAGNASQSMTDTLIVLPRAGDVIINELMPWPASGQPEWVELANRTSLSVPLDVLGLSNGSSAGFFVSNDSIAPQAYKVLTEFETELDCGLVLSDWPRLVNSDDEVVLLDLEQHKLDSVPYQAAWGIQQGHSLERIWPDSTSWEMANWMTGPPSGSPCEINISTPRPVDLAITAVQPMRPKPLRGEEDTLLVTLSNHGFLANPPGELTLLWENEEHQYPIQQIPAFDSILVPIPIDLLLGGLRPYRFSLQIPGDAIAENNMFSDTLRVGYPEGSLTLNEIAAVPPGNQPEYLEFVNVDTGRIDLSGWSIRDAGQQHHILVTNKILETGTFVVLTANADLDSYFDLENKPYLVPDSWPTLNNTTDSIVIMDATGHTVGRWFYDMTWGSIDNTSLERRALWLPGDTPENWGSSIAQDGGTPGFENSIAYPAYQVWIDSLELPAQNTYHDSLTIRVHFTTTGHFAESGTLRLFLDGVVAQTRMVDSVRFGERRVTTFNLAPQPSGNHNLRVTYTGSSSTALDSSLWIGVEPGDVLINEMMPWPASGESEWVEILNQSSLNIPLNLLGIADYSTIGWLDTTGSLAPGDLLTVSQEHMPLSCARPVSPWPGFGNSADEIRIVDRTGETIDSLTYSSDWALNQGKSIERIWPDSASTTISNWRQHPEIGTPCQLNISTPLPVDLALTAVQFDTTTLVVDAVSPITFQITNLGYETSSGGKLWVQVNDASSTPLEADLPIIQPDSTISVSTEFRWPRPGMATFTAWLEVTADPNSTNDSLMTSVFIAHSEPPLLLTEFMYLPAGTDPEWVEIYNRSTDTIQINGWEIADATAFVTLSADSAIFIPPEDYFVIQAQGNPVTPAALILASFPNLNNTGDFLGLSDPLGNWADSLAFSSKWGDREGISLERIRLNAPAASASNWGNAVSLTGATPGAQNSLFLEDIPSALALTVSPNPFSPDQDGFEDIQTIAYTLPFESGRVSVEIFDVYGRKMVTLAKNQPVAAIGELVWDGSWDYTQQIRMGIYILKFQADDNRGHVYEKLVKTYIAR